MYGNYEKIIEAAEKKLVSFEKCSELLEYPEVQADKALYLNTLSEYNRLKEISDAKNELEKVISLIYATSSADRGESEEERELFSAELFSLKEKAARLRGKLSRLLGGENISEEAVVTFTPSGNLSAEAGEKLFSSIFDYFSVNGTVSDVNKVFSPKKPYPREIAFTVKSADALAKTLPLCGVHKIYTASAPETLSVTSVVKEDATIEFDEKDVRIDLFHSSGAGGQNINKVETAIRVTHIPTGTVVTCQDERSQLKNKRRALENLRKKLTEMRISEEEERIKREKREQLDDKRRKISIDLRKNTFFDHRLEKEYPFPLSQSDAESYMESLYLR